MLPEIVVRTKAAWTDPWEWAPRLRPLNAVEQAGTGGNATFEIYHGELMEHQDLDFWIYPYEAYRGRYIDVCARDAYGWAPLWVGIIPDEDNELWGRANLDSGRTMLRALSLDYLLRHEILEFRTDAGWIFRPLTCNGTGRRGWTIEGNRSTAKCADGYYVFSDDKEMWSNRDIVELLLKAYAPANHTWTLTGEVNALEQIKEIHQLYRMRLCDALDRLIDRRRGLGWVLRPSTADGGDIAVHVYSTLADPVAVGEFTAPANADQAVVDWVGSRDLRATAHFSDIDRYRKIVVLGGPIYSTFSLSVAGGGLQKGWTTALEIAYKAAGATTPEDADRRRAGQEYDRVYRYFRVPETWNWMGDDGTGGVTGNAAPACDDNGIVQPDTRATVWRSGMVFERWLPWEESGGEEGEPDYEQPFAFVKDQDDKYQLLERLLWSEEEYFMRLTLADRELAVRVDGKRGHLLAHNWFNGADPTGVDPVADYTGLGITVQVALDERLRVVVEVPEAPGRQVKTIEVPECVVWYVVPGTVCDVVNGEFTPATSGVIRDDGAQLRAIAALAKAWYGTAHSTLELTIDKQISIAHPVGQLIRAAVGSLTAIDVGTVVTRREWDFQAFQTRIRTGFDELRFSEILGRRPSLRRRGKP